MLLELDTASGAMSWTKAGSASGQVTSLFSRAQRTAPSETAEISTPASGLVDRSKMPHLAPISPSNIARMRSEVQKTSTLIVMQSWEGFVVDRDEEAGTFTARLHDLTDKSHLTEEEAIFDLDEVESDDQELVKVGGVFRWIIGYRDFAFGKRERVSGLVFRRLPGWSESDLSQARDEAIALSNALHWD